MNNIPLEEMPRELDRLLEEIERLNKKIEQYENPEDMTLMFMWCDEKAKDEIKRLNNIIKEVREWLNKTIFYFEFETEVTSHTFELLYTAQGQELSRILDKAGDEK